MTFKSLAFSAVVCLSGCLGTSTAAAQVLKECRVAGIPNSVLCGAVSRPLDAAQPAGPHIDVHFVVVPALARRKLPDPVFLIAGGPGQSAIAVAPQSMALFSRLNNRRDIVFVDQRGTGRSAPLECPDPARETLQEQSNAEGHLQQLMLCKAKLSHLPYIHAEQDLGFFTTTQAMQDLDAIRDRLGAKQINLVGISYGTRAVLEYMRLFPGSVRRSILDAVVPPDMVLPASFSPDNQAALDALLDACERDRECAATYPQLRSDWEALIHSLPRPAIAAHPLTGVREPFELTRDMVLGAVRSVLYTPSMAAGLPAAITAANEHRYEPLLGLGSLQSSHHGAQLATGMHFSVACAEDAPRLDQARDPPGADFGDDYATLYRRVCAQWPRGAVPGEFYTVRPTTAPTLLFSGGIDPATPPRHGARMAAALGPAARHVVVPNGGHGALGSGCGRDLLFRFIDAADGAQALALDCTCAQGIPRPTVFVPLDDTPKALQ